MKDRRKIKRRVNRLLKKAGYGKYFIDCRFHPCRVTEVDFYKHDPYGCGCQGESVIDGTGIGCSYLHCGVEPITQDKAQEMAKYANTHDWDQYMQHYFGGR